MPGITTHYRATPDRLGTYPVVCNLLCGVGHSLMRSTIHVVTPAKFQAWIKSQMQSLAVDVGGHGSQEWLMAAIEEHRSEGGLD